MIVLLDLYCGAGGCAVGYKRAADELGIPIRIVGVDIKKMPRYPFEFIKGDALQFLSRAESLHPVTHIHASPPCQQYSAATNGSKTDRAEYSSDAEVISKILHAKAISSTIENVPASPIRADLMLMGTMFGLKVLRARKFECVNWFCMRPSVTERKGDVREGRLITVAGNGQLVSESGKIFQVEGDTVKQKWSNAMGIDWMTRRELSQAIPPAYTHYIGLQWFKDLI